MNCFNGSKGKQRITPMRSFKTTMRTLLGLSLAVATLVGCGAEKGLINTVQPGYVNKADFTNGEWLMGQTVVAVPAADGYTFVGDGAWTLQRLKRWNSQ